MAAARPASDEPVGWWGPFRRPEGARSVLDLIRDGVLDPPLAGLLWAALARRRSLTVVAGPSGAGKTTLLTALLDFLPSETRRVYLRGCYEPFRFLDDPEVEPARTALLVNEISPHLPIYLWGPAVRRLLGAARLGFAVYATAHAESAQELVALLTGYPLRIPADEIADLGLVLSLDAWRADGRVRRRATRLEALTFGTGGGVEVARLMGEEGGDIDQSAVVAWLAGFGEPAEVVAGELAMRDELLQALAFGGGAADDTSDAPARLRAAARARGLPV